MDEAQRTVLVYTCARYRLAPGSGRSDPRQKGARRGRTVPAAHRALPWRPNCKSLPPSIERAAGELKNSLRYEQLQYKHVADADQHVPGDTNTWLTLMLPLAIVLLISIVRRSLKEAHHAALALWAGYNFNGLVTSTYSRIRADLWQALLKSRLSSRGVIQTL